MIDNKRVLAFIPARGGSKGIPKKNIIDFCGKPLIAWTIEAALKSKYVDYVMVSTDDDEIAEISRKYGANVPFMRPEELAADNSKTIDCVLDAIKKLKDRGDEFGNIVLLQPTSPLRNHLRIDEAIEKFYESGNKGLVSVNIVEDNPVLIRRIDENNTLNPILNETSTVRRQDMREYYVVNGAIYINSLSSISADLSFNDNPIPYIMNQDESIDIDTQTDLFLAELFKRRKV